MTVHGIVVAAGRGERFGGPKSTALLAGRPLWEWGRSALLAGGVAEVTVVGPVPGGVPGGERRRDSVLAGIHALPPGVSHVLVHDAARPLASAGLVAQIIERLARGDVDGVIPVVPSRDALKRVVDSVVVESLVREEVMAAQTPQGFILDTLVAAHLGSSEDADDDATLIERVGGRIAVVPGEETNLKITHRSDLTVAEELAR